MREVVLYLILVCAQRHVSIEHVWNVVGSLSVQQRCLSFPIHPAAIERRNTVRTNPDSTGPPRSTNDSRIFWASKSLVDFIASGCIRATSSVGMLLSEVSFQTLAQSVRSVSMTNRSLLVLTPGNGRRKQIHQRRPSNQPSLTATGRRAGRDRASGRLVGRALMAPIPTIPPTLAACRRPTVRANRHVRALVRVFARQRRDRRADLDADRGRRAWENTLGSGWPSGVSLPVRYLSPLSESIRKMSKASR